MQEKNEEYKKFIAQLHALLRPSDQPKARSNQEVYSALQFDFPLVTEPEVKGLVDEVNKKSVEMFLKDYPITKELIRALHYGTDGKIDAAIRLQHLRFSVSLFSKLLGYISKSSDLANVDKLLSSFEIDHEMHFHTHNETKHKQEEPNQEVKSESDKIAQEDPDDFVYESFENADSSASLFSASASTKSDATTEQRLDALISQISYSLFDGGSGSTLWDDFRITEQFCAILSNSSSKYWRSFTPIVLVLRDRVAAVPSSLPSLLPTVITVLKNSSEVVPGEPNHRVFLSFVSGALQKQKSTISKSQLQVVASAVLPELPYIASVVLNIVDTTTQRSLPLDLVADLSGLVNVTAVVVEQLGEVAAGAVLKTGLFRDLTRIFLKFINQSHEMETFEQTFLRLLFHSQKLAAWNSQVPEFVSIIKSPFFVEQFLPDRVLWLLLLALSGVQDAAEYYKESCANLKVLIEIRSDLPLVPQLKLLHRVVTNLSLLVASSTPVWNSALMKQPNGNTLRLLLQQLQNKMKELQKRPQEGSSAKKENKLIAQVLDLLKHLLTESGKKD